MYRHVTPGTRFSTATDEYGFHHQRIWNNVAAQTKAQSKKAQDSAYGNRHRVVQKHRSADSYGHFKHALRTLCKTSIC